VQAAEAILRAQDPASGPLLAGALGIQAWIDGGGMRAPVRTALLRVWRDQGLLRLPWPVIGAAAFRPGVAWEPAEWVPCFLNAVADEADRIGQLATRLEQGWRAARRQGLGQRRDSRAPAALDVLATRTLVSATTLATTLDLSIKSALQILDRFVKQGIAVEVTHRSARRLFGLAGLAPLLAEVQPPRRSVPGRGRGRPPKAVVEALPVEEEDLPAFPVPARMAPLDFDESELQAAMEAADRAISKARTILASG